MSQTQKTLLSLLITVLLFAALSCFAFLGGFEYVEVKFYAPRMVRNKGETLEKISASFDRYADSLLEQFADFALLSENATYIEREASEEDVEKRGKAAGKLFESVRGLEGIRIVENDSVHIHFSTYDGDIFEQSKNYLAWKDYTALNEIDFANLASSDNGEYASSAKQMIERASLYFDGDGERLVVSMPYFDKYTAWRGTILFYVKAGDFTDDIIAQDLLPLNTRSKVVSPRNTEANVETPQNVGLVFGLPYLAYSDRMFMVDSIEHKWSSAAKGSGGNVERLVIVNGRDEQDVMVLVTDSSSKYCRTGWVCSESVFTFSQLERGVILVCLFITLFLIVFTLFNLKHDDMVVISSRIRKFELSLFRQYLERKNSADWRALEKEFSLHRQDVNAEIIGSLGKRGKKHRKEVNLFLDQSWSELMSAMSGGRRMAEVIRSYSDEDALGNSTTLEELPVEGSFKLDSPFAKAADAEPVEDADDVEEIEEVEEAESVDDAEEIEEAESLDDAEELEEVEEAEAVEELSEAEPLDPVNPVDSVDAEADAGEDTALDFNRREGGRQYREISAEEAARELNDVSLVPEKTHRPMTEKEKQELSSFEPVRFNPFGAEDEGKI